MLVAAQIGCSSLMSLCYTSIYAPGHVFCFNLHKFGLTTQDNQQKVNKFILDTFRQRMPRFRKAKIKENLNGNGCQCDEAKVARRQSERNEETEKNGQNKLDY